MDRTRGWVAFGWKGLDLSLNNHPKVGQSIQPKRPWIQCLPFSLVSFCDVEVGVIQFGGWIQFLAKEPQTFTLASIGSLGKHTRSILEGFEQFVCT